VCSDTQLGWAVPIYVAETDEIARKEAKVHYENFRNRFLKMPIEMLLPPGYSSIESMKGVAATKAQLTGDVTLELCMDLGMMICGSPETVRQKLEHYWSEMRFEHLISMLQFGTLPAELTAKNMELFAREVMPRLRQATAAPALAAE
jgi:alkanesulfonate monooxygenase SsuD/methylene tetrahydromethanopterin reductase-like flavin-dependent oxidoreductase (luciferase family)